MPSFDFEQQAYDSGYRAVCGVDEAGRGPLCGPVYAAACILPTGLDLPGLTDSKKLSPAKREALFPLIQSSCIAYGIAFATVEEINETNILDADMLAMRRAILGLHTPDGQPFAADFALIDGNIARNLPVDARTVVKGDALSASIAAASILAKVSRDAACLEMDRAYPQYGIAKHKGYGTKEHMELLRKYGPAPIYRTKFIRFLDKENGCK